MVLYIIVFVFQLFFYPLSWASGPEYMTGVYACVPKRDAKIKTVRLLYFLTIIDRKLSNEFNTIGNICEYMQDIWSNTMKAYMFCMAFVYLIFRVVKTIVAPQRSFKRQFYDW